MKHILIALMGLFLVFSAYGDPLPAAEAFKLEVKKIDPNTFSLQWDIKSGYFLYSNRIQITAPDENHVSIGALRLPPTLSKTDKQGHTYTIYRNHLSIPVSVLGTNPGESLLLLHYQGCSDDGFCYPPENKTVKVEIDTQLGLTSVNLENETSIESKIEKISPSNEISDIFAQHNGFMILATFFGLGLLLSFTPCILPMVPVLSGIIVGHGKSVTTKKAFFLSLSYVLSMSLTYALVGALVALLGENLQISMQSPWAIGIFSSIFVLLALSMFGFYEFKLPDSWQAKIAGSSRSQRRGHYIGAAIMGSLSTLILSPCVTAPLIGVLTYIAQTHNILLGSLTLFVLSLGMGTPLLLIGTSAGRLLPSAGSWMNSVKAFFGIALLGVAIYLLERILPQTITMLFWACLFIFSGIYSGALTPAHTAREKCHQGIGIILFLYGLLILVGTSMGSKDPLQPLAVLNKAEAHDIQPIAPFKQYTLSDVEKQIKEAQGTPIMLDFYADWCSSCKMMEATTFKDTKVIAALQRFKVIKIDLTHNNSENKELMAHYNVIAPPTFLFFDSQGKELNHFKQVGELSATQFMKVIKQVEVK